jgi:histone deacetylase 11
MTFNPDFVIYNAGTDILDGDPLGRLHISDEAIIERDDLIIDMCVKNSKPVVMLLSGGYQKANAEIIADSISNLIKKYG